MYVYDGYVSELWYSVPSKQNDFRFFDEWWLLGIGGPPSFDTHVHDAYVKLKSKNLNGKFMTVFRKVYVRFFILYTYFLELFSWILTYHIYTTYVFVVFGLPYLLHFDYIVFWSWERDSLGILLFWPTCLWSRLYSIRKLARKHRASCLVTFKLLKYACDSIRVLHTFPKNDQRFPVWMPSHYLPMGSHEISFSGQQGDDQMARFRLDLTGLGTSIRFKQRWCWET